MSIRSVTYIGPTLIRLNLDAPVRIDNVYASAGNYTIQVHSDTPMPGDLVSVLEVLIPLDSGTVTYSVFLRTTPHTNGAYYTVTYAALYDTAGHGMPAYATVPYASRDTKTQQMLRSVPGYLDTRETSLFRNLLTAISLEDDRIGGSRHDLFPDDSFVRTIGTTLMLTEGGDYLVTEGGLFIRVEQ